MSQPGLDQPRFASPIQPAKKSFWMTRTREGPKLDFPADVNNATAARQMESVARDHRPGGRIMSSAVETRRSRRADSWWVLLALPLGLTTWAAFLYAGIRTKKKSLLAFAGLYAATLAGWLVLDAGHSQGVARGHRSDLGDRDLDRWSGAHASYSTHRCPRSRDHR